MAKRRGVSEPKQKTINGRTYWHCRVSVGRRPDGTLDRKDVYGATYDECVRKRNAIATDTDRGTYIDPARMTVAAWMAQWLNEFMRDLQPSTRAEYQGVIDRHILPGLGARQLSKLSMLDCQRFINGLDLSPGSVRNVYSILHNALESARKAHLLPFNPADDLSLPRHVEKERRALTAEEYVRFVNVARSEPSGRLFIFLAETGMRIGEARGLRWTSVNFKTGEVRVVEQLAQRRRKDDQNEFTAPKRGSSRTLYPTSAAMDTLRAERAWQQEMRKLGTWTEEYGLVFTREDGTPLPYTTIDARLKRIGEKIGVPDLSAHCLRHTYATACNDAGISPKTVAAALGHKHTQITVDRYTHDTKTAQQQAAQKLQASRVK